MSWFDATSLTSFAKTALTQAQKSIDKVLDIDEEGGDTKHGPTGVKVHKTEKKSSDVLSPKPSSSALSVKGKSARRTSPNTQLSHDANSSKEDSFWSSFLGSETSNDSSKTKARGQPSSSGMLGSEINVQVSNTKGDDQATTTITDQKSVKNEISNKDNGNLKQERKKKYNKSLSASRRKKQIKEDLQRHVSLPSGTNEENEKSKENSAKHGTTANDKVETVLDVREMSNDEPTNITGENFLDNDADSISVTKYKDNTPEQDYCDGSAVSVELSKAVAIGQQKMEALKTMEEQTQTKTEISKMNNGKSVEERQSLRTVEISHTLSKDRSRKEGTSQESPQNVENQELSLKSSGEGKSWEPTQDIVDGSAVSIEMSQAVAGKETRNVLASEAKQGPCLEVKTDHEQGQLLDGGPLACSTLSQKEKRRVRQEEKNIVDSLLPDREDGSVVSIELAQSISAAKNLPTGAEESTGLWESQLKVKEGSGKEMSDKLLLAKSSSVSCSREDTRSEELELQTSQIETLQKDLESMKNILEVRESKLLCLSKENMDLQEANSILRNQIAQLEEIQKTDDAEMEELRQEFTVRIAAVENNFHTAAKERDHLKAKLEETETILTQTNEEQAKHFLLLLKEKDEQITDLLSEGENLSKQQLQSNNIIKKLRAKEKENDALISKQSKRLEETEAELKRLTEVLKIKDQNEQKHEDGIIKLNAYVKKQEEQIAKQSSDLEDAQEKIRSMQTTLDNAYKEIAELHRQNAAKDGVVQEAALSAEMMAKEERRIALEKTRREFEQQEEVLTLQISDLQTRLNRSEQQASRREDNLRQEISDLQQRLQEAEARNQELAGSVTLATRPLLRQIENLQNTHGNQASTWERIERNLTERINDTQTSLATAQEKERMASEYAQELNARVTSLETQLATYRQEKARLAAELEMNQAKLEAAEEGKTKESARLETLQAKYRKMLDDANVEKTLAEQQLVVEKGKLDAERKKMQVALEEKERQLFTTRQSSFSSVPPSPTLDTSSASLQNDSFEGHKPLTRSGSTSSTNSSVIDGMSRGVMAAGTAFVERLQAQLRQKDGEIDMLQEHVASLQKTREELTEELTRLTQKVESLEMDSVQLTDLREKNKETEQRYNAVLQMYGEKEEETEELRLDLEDVKAMYKAQIQELLGGMR